MKKKKRAFTLLEIMIVIFLIGLIGSIVGYNMKGSLEEGKVFKTEQTILKVKDLLELELAKGAEPKQINKNIEGVLKTQGMMKHPEKLMKDGWGGNLKIKVRKNGDIVVTSKKLDAYYANKKAKKGFDVDGS